MRKLRADEIDCRVATIKESGCSLLLYKDARVDMTLLDEEFGPMNWKRSHQLIDGDLFCTIEVWDDQKKCWVAKQDVGTESYTEKEKGRSSDSFKRAGFNWNIGRELYTAPFIWISKGDVNIINSDGKLKTFDHFSVRSIGYNGDRISSLEIYNDKLKRIVWTMGKLESAPPKTENAEPKTESAEKATAEFVPNKSDKNKKAVPEQLSQIEALCKQHNLPASFIYELYKKKSLADLTRVQAYSVINSFDQFVKRYEEEIPFN